VGIALLMNRMNSLNELLKVGPGQFMIKWIFQRNIVKDGLIGGVLQNKSTLTVEGRGLRGFGHHFVLSDHSRGELTFIRCDIFWEVVDETHDVGNVGFGELLEDFSLLLNGFSVKVVGADFSCVVLTGAWIGSQFDFHETGAQGLGDLVLAKLLFREGCDMGLGHICLVSRRNLSSRGDRQSRVLLFLLSV